MSSELQYSYCIVLECATILRTKRHVGWHSFIAIYRLAVSSFSEKGHICKYKKEEINNFIVILSALVTAEQLK